MSIIYRSPTTSGVGVSLQPPPNDKRHVVKVVAKEPCPNFFAQCLGRPIRTFNPARRYAFNSNLGDVTRKVGEPERPMLVALPPHPYLDWAQAIFYQFAMDKYLSLDRRLEQKGRLHAMSYSSATPYTPR